MMNGYLQAEGTATTATAAVEPSGQDLEALAWRFLASEFTGQIYAGWPIDRRLDAFLLRNNLHDIAVRDGLYDALMQRIMANIGPAHRNGVLPPHTGPRRRCRDDSHR